MREDLLTAGVLDKPMWIAPGTHFAVLMDVPIHVKEEEVLQEEIVGARLFLCLFSSFKFTSAVKNTQIIHSHTVLTFPF